jgi:hypothetical protein
MTLMRAPLEHSARALGFPSRCRAPWLQRLAAKRLAQLASRKFGVARLVDVMQALQPSPAAHGLRTALARVRRISSAVLALTVACTR